MSHKENRLVITKSELAVLNDWLTRLNYDVSCVEFRTGIEPGIGHALTAYVELHDDEGYFKLLTTQPGVTVNLQAIETAIKTATKAA